VKLARDPPPLTLLRRQRSKRAFAALVLEAIEHLVERVCEGDDLVVAGFGLDPLAGSERVDPPHQPGQPLQRRQGPPQQSEVRHQRERESHEQNGDLGERGRHRHSDRGEDEGGHGEAEDPRIGAEQPPEEAYSTPRRPPIAQLPDSSSRGAETDDAHALIVSYANARVGRPL
jgi:hypothetical protein